jgi:hypothetical protein
MHSECPGVCPSHFRTHPGEFGEHQIRGVTKFGVITKIYTKT